MRARIELALLKRGARRDRADLMLCGPLLSKR